MKRKEKINLLYFFVTRISEMNLFFSKLSEYIWKRYKSYCTEDLSVHGLVHKKDSVKW